MKNGGPPSDAIGAAAASARIVVAALDAIHGGKWPDDVDVLNVNLPAGVVRDTPAEVTRIGRSRYLECFRRVIDQSSQAVSTATTTTATTTARAGDDDDDDSAAPADGDFVVGLHRGHVKSRKVATFKHAPTGMSWEDVDEGSDTWAVKSGRISVSAVTLEGVCSATRPREGGETGSTLSWLGDVINV